MDDIAYCLCFQSPFAYHYLILFFLQVVYWKFLLYLYFGFLCESLWKDQEYYLIPGVHFDSVLGHPHQEKVLHFWMLEGVAKLSSISSLDSTSFSLCSDCYIYQSRFYYGRNILIFSLSICLRRNISFFWRTDSNPFWSCYYCR